MMDQKHNQYLLERNKDQGMTNRQAVGVFWGGVLFWLAFWCLLNLPTLLQTIAKATS
jgi:hypothetical protein